jgi:glycosyltransferase involved in cell wall biosynthesis
VPHRDGPTARFGAQRAYELEVAAFAVRLLPHLVRGRVEIVHYSEPYLGNALAAARRRLRLRFRLLLTDGLGLSARSSSRADFLHVLTPLARDEALAEGRPADRLFTIPYGFHAGRAVATVGRAEARRRLGLPVDGRLLLDVAAVNRRHKRIDALIEEAVRLPSEWTLVVAGAPEEPELLELGRARLGARFVHLLLDHDEVPLAYAAADVFGHASLSEGFGLGILEAMAAGLPVVVHRTPHFAWLTGDDAQLVDLTRPGALAEAVVARRPEDGERNRARAVTFDWSRLAGDYVAMYEAALDSP